MDAVVAEEFVSKGLAALDNGHTHLALVCFERAFEIDRRPFVCSFLGFCIATARGEVEGDVRFPEVPVGEFREVERREIDDTFPCTFVVFERHAPHA